MKECPTCKSKQKRQTPEEKNKEKFQKIKEKISKIVAAIPEISMAEIERLTSLPSATGSYADIFQCKFNGSFVALKQLRIKANQN
jgi:hypothetical protein